MESLKISLSFRSCSSLICLEKLSIRKFPKVLLRKIQLLNERKTWFDSKLEFKGNYFLTFLNNGHLFESLYQRL